MSTFDHDQWTVYAPTVCMCIDARIGTITTINGGRQHVFILEFIIHDTEQVVTKFFNVSKTPKGDYAIPHESDFAKLHRRVTGQYKKARYSRAQQLLKHMVGHRYVVEYEPAESSKKLPYLKATKVKPVEPIISEQWYPSGRLQPKTRSPNTRRLINVSMATVKQQLSKELAIEKQKASNDLAMDKAEEPHPYLDSSEISIPLKHTTLKHNQVGPYPHASLVGNKLKGNKYKTTRTIKGGVISYQYYQRPNETLEQYHERVIDESWDI
jgi:hypothetical protein